MKVGKSVLIAIAFAKILIAIMIMPVAQVEGAEWLPSVNFPVARVSQSATRLTNGKVLIAGGAIKGAYCATATSSAVLYSPETNTWNSAGSMLTPRYRHAAVLLPSGKVFIVGGSDNCSQGLLSAEIYDPMSDSWSSAGSSSYRRGSNPTATVLKNGKVLVVGGYNGKEVAATEIYDPETNSWSAAAPMLQGRYTHTATLLTDGRLLVTGGFYNVSITPTPLSTAELYDPAANSWSPAGSMSSTRAYHASALLPNGKVLTVGGKSGYFASGGLASAELYDPITNDWSITSSLSTSRTSHTATLLQNGNVLIVGGGGAHAELFDTLSETWTTIGPVTTDRSGHSASLLHNGKVLIAGGSTTINTYSTYLSNSQLFDDSLYPPVVIINGVWQTGFALAWGAVSEATGYYLDISTDSGFSQPVERLSNIDIGNVNSYAIDGLNPGKIYYYRLHSYNSSELSVSSSATAQITLPATPTALSHTSLTATGFTANWEFVNSATSYQIDVAQDSNFASYVAGYVNKDVGNVTSFAVTGLTSTSYYYRVKARNSGGNSPNSNAVVTILPRPPVAPVTIAATTLSQSGFVANWNAVSDTTGYNLDISTSSTFASFVTGYNNKDVGNTLSFSITSLAPGTSYYYRVRAYNSFGAGNYSNNSSIATYPAIPPKPLLSSTVNVSQTGFTINWAAASGGTTGYFLDISSTSSFSSFIPGFNNLDVGYVTDYALTNLSPGTRYYYRLRSYNALGTSSDNSDSFFQNTLSITPTATSATNITNTGFTANWNIVGATGYRLDVALDCNFTNFVTDYNNRDVGNVASYAVSGLTPVITYYYRVRGYVTGAVTQSSNVISLTTLPNKPITPIAASATLITSNSFAANWIPVATADGYMLDLAKDSAFANLISGYSNKDVGDVTSYTFTGLNPGSAFYYRVRAYNAGGTSSSSNTIMQITPTDGAPPPVINSFSIPATSTSSTISIFTLVATDNNVITGYMLTETGTPPEAAATGWSESVPTSYTFNNIPEVIPTAKTLYAWAKNAGGNVSTSASANTIITIADVTAPTLSLISTPLKFSNQVSGIILFNSNETATFECKLDNESFTTCSSPYSYTNLSNGQHTFYLRATDSYNNTSVPTTFNWNINSTLAISSPILLPQSGQVTCYNTVGTAIACLGTGQDGDILAGIELPATRFSDNGDLTISDGLTGLMWPKDANTMQARDPSISANGTVYWQDALAYIDKLNSENYLGYNDWRLPNINEIESLVFPVNDNSVFINNSGFYWSSSSAAYNSLNNVIVIELPYYYITRYSQIMTARVWPVRSTIPGVSLVSATGQAACYGTSGQAIGCSGTGQDGASRSGVAWPSSRFVNNGSQVITDNLTGLLWTQNANLKLGTWQSALDYVKSLNSSNYLGYNDWRLPNVKELRSLINYSQTSNSSWLISQGFNNVQALDFKFYWSSDSYRYPFRALCVSMWLGDVFDFRKDDSKYVWPVRGGYVMQRLSVNKSGLGSGAIELNTGSLTWDGLKGTARIDPGNTIILTATPSLGSAFSSWTGCDSASVNTCTVAMNSAKSVTATFNIAPINGVCGIINGSSLTSVPTTNLCTAGTATVVTGTGPWTWNCTGLNSGTTAICSASIGVPLTLTFAGTGGGSVNGDMSSTSELTSLSKTFTTDSTVHLIATPNLYSIFSNWTGACNNANSNCSILMDSAKSVTATFTAAPKAKVLTKSFSTLQSAYDDSATMDNVVIKLLNGTLTNNLIAGRGITVNIEGGYNSVYSGVSTETTIQGPLRIKAGTVRVKGVNVK